ncbi:MAG: S1 RNA-binding domain-containing protein [Acholeplasmataceae bacterium]
MQVNDRILCLITGIKPYGIFVSYKDYQGLIHISEVSDRYIPDLNLVFNLGEKIYATILSINEEDKQLSLSYKNALLIDGKVLKQVDIKIGFKTLRKQLNKWIKEEKERNND